MKQSAVKALNRYSKSFIEITNKDFFGIAHITSKDIAGCFKSEVKLPSDQVRAKYQPLLVKRNHLENEENKLEVTFGVLRFDNENIPRVHGQYEPSNTNKMYDTIDVKQKFVPSDDVLKNNPRTKIFNDKDFREPDVKPDPNYREAYRIIDVEPSYCINEALLLFKSEDQNKYIDKYTNTAPLIFYFETSNSQAEPIVKTVDPLESESSSSEQLPESAKIETSSYESISGGAISDPYEELEHVSLEDLEELPGELRETNELGQHLDESKFDKSLDEKYDVKEARPMQALDYLKKVRSHRIEPTAKGLKHRMSTEQPYSFKPSVKLDSMGFRNYSNQVPNWNDCRHIDVLNHIKKSIVYNNYDILAVNKPYGIASHEEDRDRERFDINNLVQEIATQMRIEKVYLAHRLDKSTTGVLLFATSQERARNLNKLFKSDQIKKTYLCITKGVPDPEQAIIDIPIGEYTVSGKVRSCLAPERINGSKQLAKRYREARRAITEYNVLNSQKHAALVEVKPRTGVKHQIRCHLGFGINNPILGDHKYSNIGKLAPQRLPVPLLNDLHLRQAKVRTLPLHLHAKTIVIPGVKANKETLFISAPLPYHFTENMKSLSLSLKENGRFSK